MASVLIKIRPKAAPRPRVTRNGTYNPIAYTNYKKAIALIAKTKFDKKDTALKMHIEFFFKIPKSWSKVKKESIPHHTSVPDVDNLIKGIKDALNGVAYNDDSQVISVFARKQYGDEDSIFVEVLEVKNNNKDGQ